MITNGVVSIEDGTKAKEEFAPARKVRVELTFAVAEGSDPTEVLDKVRSLAASRVDLELGRKYAEMAAPVTEAKKPGRPKKETPAPEKTKADLEQELIAELTGGTPPAPAPVEPEADNGIDDLLGEQAPAPITDAELAKAAQTRNAQMKQKDPNFALKIRALVVEYAGQPPKKITDVPVAKRQEFMDKLKDLT